MAPLRNGRLTRKGNHENRASACRRDGLGIVLETRRPACRYSTAGIWNEAPK